ncbi:MAG: signal peptidase I [Coriobacteriia bacterium]
MTRFIKPAVNATVLVSAALVALMILLPAAMGLQRYVITGGSMTGTISKGSVVYSKVIPVTQLREGDIVTFVPPSYAEPVTHRIIGITMSKDGERLFQTKGDFNEVADPWKVTFAESSAPVHVFHVPYVGYLLALLSLRWARMLLIGLPALIIALSLLWSMWNAAGVEVRRQEAEASESETLPVPQELS